MLLYKKKLESKFLHTSKSSQSVDILKTAQKLGKKIE